MRVFRVCLVCLVVFASACSRRGEKTSDTAIREAIEKYLAQQSNVLLNNLTVEVKHVEFQGDRANADVNFRSKQSPDMVMGRRYLLRRVDGDWRVESSSSPAGMGGPHGGPPMSQPATGSGTEALPQPSH